MTRAPPATSRPQSIIAYGPKRPMSCAEKRMENSAMTMATGRKARPSAIGP